MENYKKFYIIDFPLGNYGFFAHFMFLLGQLDFAYENNLIPVVDWSNSQLANTDKQLFYGLFKSKFTFDEITESNSILCPRDFRFFVKGKIYEWPIGYPPRETKIWKNPEIIKHLNFLYNYYFEVNELIIEQVKKEINIHKTLGVHCRRSDMIRCHPECTLESETSKFYEKTLKIFEQGNFDNIYLATEEKTILNYFLDRLGGILIYQDCLRLDNSYDDAFWEKGELDGKLISKEVLIDSLSLSVCKSLITGISGVTYGSIIFNGLKYNDVFYFDEI